VKRTKTSTDPALDRQLGAAIKANRAGQASRAIGMLKTLAAEYPKSAAVIGYLGGVYFEQERFADAEKAFRKTVALSPKSELASLGLFHSLWSLGRRHESFAEMRRLLTNVDSEEYKTLLRDLAVAGELERELDAVAS
jgi:predicted Zn-dependent protease